MELGKIQTDLKLLWTLGRQPGVQGNRMVGLGSPEGRKHITYFKNIAHQPQFPFSIKGPGRNS